MSNFDFYKHFEQTQRRVDTHLLFASVTRLVWAFGCIGILGSFLWLIGRLAQVW